MMAIIQYVLFPIMSYSDEDEELWTVDPHEYIRVKFGESSFMLQSDTLLEFLLPDNAMRCVIRSKERKQKNIYIYYKIL